MTLATVNFVMRKVAPARVEAYLNVSRRNHMYSSEETSPDRWFKRFFIGFVVSALISVIGFFPEVGDDFLQLLVLGTIIGVIGGGVSAFG